MRKTCKDLFAGIDCTIIGNENEFVEGIAYRSDRVRPHDAFFCIVGLVADGHSFAQDAIDRGAKVLVVERKVYLADATDVTEVVVKDTRKARGHRRRSSTIRRRASRWWASPARMARPRPPIL